MTTPVEKNLLAIKDLPKTDLALEKSSEPIVEDRVEKAANLTLTNEIGAQTIAPDRKLMVSVAVETEPLEKSSEPKAKDHIEKTATLTITNESEAQTIAPEKVRMVNAAVQTEPLEKEDRPTAPGVEGHLQAASEVKASLTKAVKRMSPVKLIAFTALQSLLDLVKAKETKSLLCYIIDKKIP